MNISKFKVPSLPERLEQDLLGAKWEKRDVLVGCLRDRKQLDICLRHGFYHMPAHRLEGESSEVRYVAIYQSQNLFGGRAGVRYYGRVTGCETVVRKEITQIPRDSDELYLRFAVDRWRKLPRTVTTKELPVTHMRTTAFLLHHSTEVPELFLEDGRQFRLYRAMKKLLARPRIRIAGFRFGDRAVVLKKGEICILRDGEAHATYLQEHYKETPHAVFTSILQHLS